MPFRSTLFAAAAVPFLITGSAFAQSPDTIFVFDGSGSMWGQIDGRAKIEIARDTLSSVLTEIPSDANVGMIAYGHRQKGVCSDIETVVPVGPASQTVRRMIDVANQLNPKGKTPLSDAVRIAAQDLRFTENAATVVLVTDGIETCDADPCALATELENAGLGFTAHVVGFGLSDEEGRQVQCLAANTGGLYLSANNADELGNALRQVVQSTEIAPDPSDFEPMTTVRNVRFILRDTADGDQIGIRQLSGSLERADGTPVADDAFQLTYPEASGNSAVATLEPGNYVAVLQRDGGSAGGGYDVRYAFAVPEGAGDHLIEASLSGTLKINIFINPNLAWTPGDAFPTAVGGSRPRFNFAIFPVVNGQKTPEPIATRSSNNLEVPLPSGTYLVQGNIDSGTSAERLVTVDAGTTTQMDFSFDATRVFVDARETNGAPVKRQSTYWYDKARSGRNYWVSGKGQSDNGPTPFYLPTGTWKLNVGGEGYGARRSERLVTIPGDYQDLRLQVGESELLSAAELGFLNDRGNGCLEILKVRYNGCLVERANLSVDQAENSTAPTGLPNPSTPLKIAGANIPSALEGLKGNAYAFRTADTGRMAYIVFDPTYGDDALMVLENDWCGTGNCAGRRVRVPASSIDGIITDNRQSGRFFTADFEIEYTIFGPDDKVLAVTPNGQAQFQFDLTEVIDLDGGSAALPASQPEQVSLGDNVNQIYGVFSLYTGDDPIAEITGDFYHTQQCQRRVTVIYPDGAIAVKQFQEPQSETDNPFKVVGSGACNVTGASYTCEIADSASGATEQMVFTSGALGDNHYRLLQDNGETMIAASCFFPGGEFDASMDTPLGRTMSELMLERPDGRALGMGYDANNNAYRGQ